MTKTYSAKERTLPELYPSWRREFLPLYPAPAFWSHIMGKKKSQKGLVFQGNRLGTLQPGKEVWGRGGSEGALSLEKHLEVHSPRRRPTKTLIFN